ncbi:hypothetical protein MMC14_004882 [Varicellaria rhodocarpa]|nr:hypothetical protein [Varicellaria rhodocarpa]
MLLWSCAGVPLGIYNISEKLNVALRVQPQILSVLSLITLGQCVYYEKTPISRDVAWPTTLTASLSAGFLAAGVLRHYWDIYIFRTVRGISFIFVALDAAGDLFSLLSLR